HNPRWMYRLFSFLICVTAPASRERSSDAEPHDVIAVVGGRALSGGRARQARRKRPGASAIHAEALSLAVVRTAIARGGLVRAPICGSPGVGVVVTLPGPLPNA